MVVTEIKPVNSKKSRIYIDEEFAFVLYKGEIRRYHLAEGEKISEEDYREIMQEVLLKRGKARAMHLLQSMDRTEGQIRRKLREGGYPEEVTAQILEYVKGYHYVDDSRYVSTYLRTKGSSKSIRQMRAELQNKGVSSEVIQDVLEQENSVDEASALRRWMEKKNIDIENANQEQLRKFYQFLQRKGFRYDDIQRELKLFTHY